MRSMRPFVGFFGIATLGCVLVAPAVGAAATPEELARGKYIFGATGGCGCHTRPNEPVNSGGRRYDGPFGTVYSSNITPDIQTGIGGWTDQQVIDAIRRPATGRERLVPVAPIPPSMAWPPTIWRWRWSPTCGRSAGEAPDAAQARSPLPERGTAGVARSSLTGPAGDRPRASRLGGVPRAGAGPAAVPHAAEPRDGANSAGFSPAIPRPEDSEVPNITPTGHRLTWTESRSPSISAPASRMETRPAG
jgi:hypothetical protein